jgi:ACS family tartrate transporter-like MFS transporter
MSRIAKQASVGRSALVSPDAAVGRTAVRKACWRLLPLIGLGYGIAYMDRVNISFASLQMNRDLHFSATIYGFGAGLFFLSYAACEVPSNLLLLRFGARRWLSRIMITWGVLAVAMMFVRTPVQFYIVRFLLGVAEAGFFPGVIFYLMQWFPPDLRARVVSRFYISLPLSTAVMGIVAGALLSLQGRMGLAGWQWLFLIEGLPAILLGIAFLFCVPDTPAHASWLCPEEQDWLLAQVRNDAAATAAHSENATAALRERRVWLMGLVFVCMHAAMYAYTFSAPAILQRLTGWSVANVGYLIAAMNVAGAAGMVWNATHSDRRRERFLHTIVPFLLFATGFLIGGISTAAWLAVPALAIVAISYNSAQGPLMSIPAIFLKGKQAAAGFAMINTIGMVGGFLGPYWMGLAKDFTGDYQHGLLTLTAPALCAAVLLAGIRKGLTNSPSV